MTTKIAKQKETFVECEVKRRRVAPDKRGYESFWKVRLVQDAVDDGDAEYRCKDCHGAVKLHRRKAAQGPASHVEHKLKTDSEFCSAGLYFQQATDGRMPRLSESPVV